MAQQQQATRDAMFPKLEPDEIERVAQLGRRRVAEPGEILIELGEPAHRMFVVLEGRIDIVSPRPDGEVTVTSHGPGEFTGEIAMLQGQPALIRARAVVQSELIELDRAQLRRVIERDAQLGEIILRAFLQRRSALISRSLGNVVLLGSKHSGDTLRLREFMTRSGHPFTYLDVDDDSGVQEVLDHFGVGVGEVPVLLRCNSPALRRPTNAQVADVLGLNPILKENAVHDVVVVGAGPAGLAAAVYAASEGLKVLVVEGGAPGGQAGSSSRIENYLGFPDGISGQDLTQRAWVQAQKFGAEIAIASGVRRLACGRKPFTIEFENGKRAHTRTVIVATGAAYRQPDCAKLAAFVGTGVYYGATHVEAQLCKDQEVGIVGAGNSAGQAAIYLSSCAKHVHMLVRGEGLSDSMSRYLIARIESTPLITLRTHTEVVEVAGNSHLERVTWRHKETRQSESHDLRHLFLMTGAVPNSKWLDGCVVLDEKGFVKTGRDLRREDLSAWKWPLRRAPYPLESSIPGVFAVGDVRAGSVKRVASAVGEGSVAVQFVHSVLAE